MTSTAPLYLGIDAGGSKTAWLVLCGDAVVCEGETAGMQVNALGADVAAQRLRSVFELARGTIGRDCDGVVAGLAGAGSREVRADLLRALAALGKSPPLHLVGDVQVAAAAALSAGPGVAVWSGTGSFAVARAADGLLHRVGGRGWLLGDQGSAFDMARRAAAAVVDAEDGLGPPTALRAALLAAAAVAAATDLGRALQARPPRDLAALYPSVRATAEHGDAAALAVQRGGAEALSALVLAAARRARLHPQDLRVIAGGGVLQHDATFLALVQAACAARGLCADIQLCVRSAAHGAAKLAQAVALRSPPMCSWLSDGAA
jgi:N-acetylglucosamine kinase-like BadF-type ATPase